MLPRLPESFLEKLQEFLRQFASTQLRRCQEQPGFPLLEFLQLLYRLTLQQGGDRLLGCLEVWGAVLDQVKEGEQAKYKEALLALARALLERLQYRHHGRELEGLDREGGGEEGRSQWQEFLATLLEMVMRVAEVVPEEVLHLAESAWREAGQAYTSLEGPVAPHLLPLLRDHCSLLQLCGRLAALYTGDNFIAKLPRGLDTVRLPTLLPVLLFRPH